MIIDTGHPHRRAAQIVIDAPPAVVFEVLATPAMHARFDGSGTVRGRITGPDRLALGSRFGMAMRIGLPYRVTNQVVDFEEGRRIAWCHLNRHQWRYELEPVGEHSTLVTETFDGSTARWPVSLKLMRAYDNNQVAIAKTLVRLKELVESSGA